MPAAPKFDYSSFASKYTDWSKFSLNELLLPVQVDRRNSSWEFLRRLKMTDDPKFQPLQLKELRDSGESRFGLGEFMNVDGRKLPTLVSGRTLMLNSVIDAYDTALREIHGWGVDVEQNVSRYDVIPLWAAYVIMKLGILKMNGRTYPLHNQAGEVQQYLSGMYFEDLVVFVAAGRMADIPDWAPLLESVKANPKDFPSYSPERLVLALKSGEDLTVTENAFRVHGSIFDALFT